MYAFYLTITTTTLHLTPLLLLPHHRPGWAQPRVVDTDFLFSRGRRCGPRLNGGSPSGGLDLLEALFFRELSGNKSLRRLGEGLSEGGEEEKHSQHHLVSQRIHGTPRQRITNTTAIKEKRVHACIDAVYMH